MPTSIIDASAAGKLVRPEAESAALRDWLRARPDDDVVAPDVLAHELHSLARKSVRSGEWTLAEAVARCEDALHAIELVHVPPARALTVAHERSLGYFDGAYAALAIDAGGILVTYDADLAARAGVPALSPRDQDPPAKGAAARRARTKP